MRRAPSLLPVAALGCVSVLTIALLAAPAAVAASTSHSLPATWTTYFYPLKLGWTCHESLTSVAGGDETLTVTAATKVKNGQAVTVDEGSSTEVNGVSVPTNAALHYILTKSGQLISEPSAGQLAGQAYRVQGDTIYPSVLTLLAGGSGISRVRIDAPLARGDLSKLTGVLKPHATTLNMALNLKQTGSEVALLRTPAGTFHHLMAVHSTLHSLDITDATNYARQSLDSELRPTVAKSVTNTVWYAPGFGPVKVSVGGITGVITDCSAGSDTTTSSTSTTTTTTTTSTTAAPTTTSTTA